VSRALRLLLSGPVLSAIWLLLCGFYIQSQVGWGVLFQLLPHEIAITALGVLAPLAFIWVVTGFYARAAALTESSQKLAERVDALVFPSQAAEARARQAGESLQTLAEALNASSTQAVERLQGASGALAGRLETIVTSVASAAERAERSERELVAVSAMVTRLIEGLQSHTRSIEQVVARDLTSAAERLASQITVVELAVSRAFAAGGQRAFEQVEGALAQIGGMIDKVASRAADQVAQRSRDVEQQLTGAADRLDTTAVNLTTSARRGFEVLQSGAETMTAASGKAAAQSEVLTEAMRGFTGELSRFSEQAAAQTEQLATAVTRQAEALRTTAAEALQRLEEASDGFSGQADYVTQTARQASARVEEVGEGLRQQVGEPAPSRPPCGSRPWASSSVSGART
jgi:hypothetical protein